MADVATIILVKRFTYRDKNEEWSNRYHFTSSPVTPAAWDTAFTSLATKEKAVYGMVTKIVRAYGYEVGQLSGPYVKDYTAAGAEIAGTFVQTGGLAVSGDVASTVRWWTGAVLSNGRKVYLRKYFHDAYAQSSNPDKCHTGYLTALSTFGSGILGSGAITGMGAYCGPDGDIPTTSVANPYLTTRTLKRRGKRPPT